MMLRSIRVALLVGLVVVCGCNGCLKYVPKLDEAEVVSIADRKVAELGYDLARTKPLNVRVDYIAGSCLWGVDYSFYNDRLPAGPLIFVDDRTRAAGVGPSM